MKGRAGFIAAILCAGAACGHDAPARRTALAHVSAQSRADTARGDSAALAALPPALAQALDLGGALERLATGPVRDTAHVRCDRVEIAADRRSVRRRLRVRRGGGAASVLFVRVDSSGGMRRVELVRRDPRAGQRGFIWDATDDAVQSVLWDPAGRSPPEVTTLPNGGPLPRALRALGRRLLAVTCTGTVRA